MALGVEWSTSVEVRVTNWYFQPHVLVTVCLTQFFSSRRAQGVLRSRRSVVGRVRSGCSEGSIVCIICERALPGPRAHQVVLHLELLEPACAETSLHVRVVRRCREGLRLLTDRFVRQRNPLFLLYNDLAIEGQRSVDFLTWFFAQTARARSMSGDRPLGRLAGDRLPSSWNRYFSF